MDVREAYKIVSDKHENLEAIKCIEYESVFVFDLVPKNLDPSKHKKFLNGLVFVDKETGKVGTFNPLSISTEEYRSGKEIKQFR